jgi:hypothetical protein
MPFNVTGQPAATICCGFGSDGFPLAFQLAGRAFDEAACSPPVPPTNAPRVALAPTKL